MNTPSQAQVRRAIAEAQTIVVKVGSSSLTEPSGHLDPERLNALVAALARVRLMGGRVVLVSSGAIAAGFGSLGFDARSTDVADQQACAAVGQGLLMAQYEAAFARYGLRVGQILITVSDTIAPQQYRNVRRTLERLLDLGAVPIINENDSLASNEIRFGDNDRLSALIANIVVADALVLLTDVTHCIPHRRVSRNPSASHTCRMWRPLWKRCRSAEPARTSVPAVWSPRWRPRAWRPSPASRPYSPAPPMPDRP